jgi:hypothetical protein
MVRTATPTGIEAERPFDGALAVQRGRDDRPTTDTTGKPPANQ